MCSADWYNEHRLPTFLRLGDETDDGFEILVTGQYAVTQLVTLKLVVEQIEGVASVEIGEYRATVKVVPGADYNQVRTLVCNRLGIRQPVAA